MRMFRNYIFNKINSFGITAIIINKDNIIIRIICEFKGSFLIIVLDP